MLAFLPLDASNVSLVRDSAVVAAPPFAGFTTRLSADGTTALTAGYDGSLMFWRVAPNGVTSFLDALHLGGPTGADGATFTMGPNGRYFAAAHTDGELEV